MNRWISLSENRNCGIKPNRNYRTQKYTVTEVIYRMSQLDTEKEKISKLEDRIIESIQIEAHREKRTGKKNRS